MSQSKLGFVGGGGGGLSREEIQALINQDTGYFVSNNDGPSPLNTNAIPTLTDESGKVIKRSRVTITNDDELNTNKLSLGGGSYSLPTAIGTAGQILAVPSVGTELKFLNVDPSPTDLDDLQIKTQNILLPLTVPGETTLAGNVSSIGGYTVGLSAASNAWNLVPGLGDSGDQLLFPSTGKTAYWGKAPAIQVLESVTQNIDYNLTSPTRTEFIGTVNVENGVGFGVSPNYWKIPVAKGTVTGQQMLWNNANNETKWGEAPAITDLKTLTGNIVAGQPTVYTQFDGGIDANDYLSVGEEPNDYRLVPGRGTTGQVLTVSADTSILEFVTPESVNITALETKTQNIVAGQPGVYTQFDGGIDANDYLSVGQEPFDYRLVPGRGTTGQVLSVGANTSILEFVTPQTVNLTALEAKTQNQTASATNTVFNNTTTVSDLYVNGTLSIISNDGPNPLPYYALPTIRGTPGQVITVGNDPGICTFEDAASVDLKALETKTQNQTAIGVDTFFTGRFYVDGDLSIISNGGGPGPHPFYKLPTLAGTPGQVITAGLIDPYICTFEDPGAVDLTTLEEKTQHQTANNQGTNFDLILTAEDVNITNSVQINSDAPTQSYYLPYSRGNPGQVLTAGADPQDCSFQDVPTVDLTALENKTRHQTANAQGTTFDLFFTAEDVNIKNSVQINSDAPTQSYYLPIGRGTTGQVLTVGADPSICTFQDASTVDITALENKTRHQTANAQGTTFDLFFTAEDVKIKNSIEINSDASTQSYYLPYARGTTGQVLTAGADPQDCFFQDAPTTDLTALEEKTKFQSTQLVGTTFTGQLTSTSSVNALYVNATDSVQIASGASSYILPLTRGSAGQLLAASGVEGEECIFEDKVITSSEKLSLQDKTQNIVNATTVPGATFFTGSVDSSTLRAPTISARTTVLVNTDSATQFYQLPLVRGTPGQVLVASGASGETCQFEDVVVDPGELELLLDRTQNIDSVTTEAQTTRFIGTTQADRIRVSGFLAITDPYTLPLGKGTSGQFLIAGGATGSDCSFTSKNVLPDIAASSANQTIMSTNGVGGYAWTPAGTTIMWRNVTETVPPTGVTLGMTLVKANILSSIGINSRISSGVSSTFPPNNFISYNGAFTRAFTATFTCDLEGDSKDNPTIELTLENTVAASILSRSHAQLLNNTFRHFTLTAVGTIASLDRLAVFLVSSVVANVRVHNPNFSFSCS